MGTDWKKAVVAMSATVIALTAVFVLYWAKPVLVPVALAVFLTFILTPVVTRLERLRLGRTPSVVLAIGLLLLVITGVGSLISYEISQLADTLPERRGEIRAKVEAARNWVVRHGQSRFSALLDDVTEVLSPEPEAAILVRPAPPSIMSRLDYYVSPAAELLTTFAFTLILTIFMLLKREDLRNRVVRLIGHGHVSTTTRAVDDASERISQYLISQFLMNAAFGTLIAAGLYLLGVKYAILWGFIAALLRYVPYIGIWLALLPVLGFSVATAGDWGGGWGQPIGVLFLFGTLEAISSNFIEPMAYGRSTGLSEVAQLIAAAMWAFLWGPIGLLLSSPLTVCMLVLGRHVTRFQFFVVLLGDEPALSPEVALYQRLIARDQDEASAIVHRVAKESGVTEALDSVLIPALCLARRDAAAGDLEDQDMSFAVRAAGEIAHEVEVTEDQRAAKDAEDHVPVPIDQRVKLLICPARDEAEAIAAEVFTRTLDNNRWEIQVTGDETLASELVEKVGEDQPAAVVIATLPPGGISHARYLVTRLRRRFPDLNILVGRWGCGIDTGESPTEDVADSYSVDRTFAETRKRLEELFPVLSARSASRAEEPADAALVGTRGA